MDLSKYFILLNDEPKTLQIDAIQRNGIKGYSVRFKNNKRTYNYGCDKVFGSTIQNGKTLLNVRSLWIANYRMTSAKFGDLIIMDIPVGGSSTTVVLCRMMLLAELLLLNPVSKRR